MQIDYLIVGQGLAGTVLAEHLLRKNKKILIIDEYNGNSSSRVAAGLFNPITGKRFVKSWNANQLFPYLHDFYAVYEKSLQERFFFPVDIYRPFSSIEELNDWQGNSAKPGYNVFIKEIYKGPQFNRLNDPGGGVLIQGGGFLDLPLMLKKAREMLLSRDFVLEERYDHNLTQVAANGIRYKDYEAKKLIFCGGFVDAQNPYFNWLPFRPVKGEVLHLRSEVKIDMIYNKNCFITPEISGLNKCGSTYDWRDLSEKPTLKGRDTILSNLKALINWDVHIVEQRAGIRPASLDRRPLIGLHPELTALAIFNGLGTKGVTLAPYYANQFVKFLEDGTNLDAEVNIERYYSLY